MLCREIRLMLFLSSREVPLTMIVSQPNEND
jgi:hypothetical protein